MLLCGFIVYLFCVEISLGGGHCVCALRGSLGCAE